MSPVSVPRFTLTCSDAGVSKGVCCALHQPPVPSLIGPQGVCVHSAESRSSQALLLLPQKQCLGISSTPSSWLFHALCFIYLAASVSVPQEAANHLNSGTMWTEARAAAGRPGESKSCASRVPAGPVVAVYSQEASHGRGPSLLTSTASFYPENLFPPPGVGLPAAVASSSAASDQFL